LDWDDPLSTKLAEQKFTLYKNSNYHASLPTTQTTSSSDSSIVLSWLSFIQLKAFVENWASEILHNIPRKVWRASRGLMAADLIDFRSWWNGLLWLRDKDQYLVRVSDSPFGLSLSDRRIQGEVRSNCWATVAVATQVHPLIHFSSSFTLSPM